MSVVLWLTWERAGVLASEKEEPAAGEAAVTREDLTDAGLLTPESRRSIRGFGYGRKNAGRECG